MQIIVVIIIRIGFIAIVFTNKECVSFVKLVHNIEH